MVAKRAYSCGSFLARETSAPGDEGSLEWSPDGRSIVFSHQPSPHINDWPLADVSIVDVESGRVRALAATKAAESDPHFSPDGKFVAFDQSNDPPTWRRRSRVAMPAARWRP